MGASKQEQGQIFVAQAVQHVTEQEKIHAYYRLVQEFVKLQTDKCEPEEGSVKRNSRGGGALSTF